MSKQIGYIVFRIGSNAANQPSLQRLVIGTVTAANPREASFAASEKFAGECYNNQHVECKARWRCKGTTCEAADRAEAERAADRAYWASLQPAR